MLLRCFYSLKNSPKILITGASGQLGKDFASHFRLLFGNENVLCTSNEHTLCMASPSEYVDVCDMQDFMKTTANFGTTVLIHLAAILSSASEVDPDKAISVNVRGTENALKVADHLKLKVFVPSSIATFDLKEPNLAIQRPTYMYGITKLYAELLGEWYHKTRGLDFRSLRYPGIISCKQTPKGGGTTDWASSSYFAAVKQKAFECFVNSHQTMSMVYIDDVLKGTSDFLFHSDKHFTKRTYNVHGCSFNPVQQLESIRKSFPNFEFSFHEDHRQCIAHSWPESLDDSAARRDWGWNPQYDLERITSSMFSRLGVPFGMS